MLRSRHVAHSAPIPPARAELRALRPVAAGIHGDRGRLRRQHRAGRARRIGAGAGRERAQAHRRASSHRAAVLVRRGERPDLGAGRRPHHSHLVRVVAAGGARGDGQERRPGRHHLHDHARHLLRRRAAGAPAFARVQRLRHADRQGSPRALRPVRHAAAAGHRRQPQGDRIFLRCAQGRRHRADDELWRQVARRPRLRAGVRRAQPPQGGDLRASGLAAVLHEPDVLRPAVLLGVPAGHHAHDPQPDLLRFDQPASRYPFHLLACGRHAADGGRPHRALQHAARVQGQGAERLRLRAQAALLRDRQRGLQAVDGGDHQHGADLADHVRNGFSAGGDRRYRQRSALARPAARPNCRRSRAAMRSACFPG